MINIIINGTIIEIYAIPSDTIHTLIASAKSKLALIERFKGMEKGDAQD